MARQISILFIMNECGSVKYSTTMFFLLILIVVNSIIVVTATETETANSGSENVIINTNSTTSSVLSDDTIVRPASQQQLLLPDTSGIDGQLTANHNVDHFFSLWLVFHNDDIKLSDQPFTIFAPINAATKENNGYLRNPEHVKQILLNHIVVGSQLNLENVTEDLNVTALSGRTIQIVRKNQKLYANDALIINPKVHINGNGILVILDNFVLGKIDLNNTQQPENIPEDLLTTISGNLTNSTLSTTANNENTTNTKLIENIFQVLSFFKEGVRVFQHFLSKSNVTKLLKNGQEYTVLVPIDFAFQRWHPIDWGFYPFSVPEFTEDILRNHFIIGNIRQNNIKEGLEVKTLGGRTLKFSLKPTLSVNGVTIAKGDTHINGGNMMFINEVLFVSESVVSRLHQQHKDKETPPLLAFPWFGAQFLSHAFLALERDRRFSQITRFLNLADLAPHVSGTGYTFFVPVDSAFEKIGLTNMPDNYLTNKEGLKLLLNHFVKKRLYKRDFINGTSLTTLGGDSIAVLVDNGNITLNGANVIESEVFVYNLGTMYYVDRLLFPLPSTLEEFTTSITDTNTIVPPIPTTKETIDTETIPEEIAIESGISPDVLLEETTLDKETSTQVIPLLLTNKLNSSNPIK